MTDARTDILSVVLVGDVANRFVDTCHASLTRFTPELREIVSLDRGGTLRSALRHTSGPFVAVLQTHVAVSPGWAGRLIGALEGAGAGAGAAGPLSNGASGPQHLPADYQDIPGYLEFAERIARERAGRVQAVARLDECCIVSRRRVLATLDPDTTLATLADAIRAAGHPAIVALDTYLHSFADYYRHARSDLLALVPASARTVLDVGCGAGALGAAIKAARRATVIGVEVDARAAEQACGVLDRVHVGDIEQLELPYGTGTFDCIVLADLLEHLRDPWGLVGRLAPLLSLERGRLIASLPNVRHWSVIRGLLQGEWVYLPAGILDRAHLRFFTRHSGRALFEAAGLEVVEIHPSGAGAIPDLGPLVAAARSLGLDPSTLAEEAAVAQYLYVARRRP